MTPGPERFRRHHWPVLVAMVLLLALVWGSLGAVLRANDGHLIYAFDDAYIHMAMARNLAAHGVFGVTPYAFTSTSSSILWTLMLALIYFPGGPSKWAPLALNVLCAVAVLILVGRWLRRAQAYAALSLIMLIAVVITTPLPSLVFFGMEHTLHTLASLVLAASLWRVLAVPDPTRAERAALLVGAVLVAASRYEGLFMIAMASGALVLDKRRALAAGVALFGSGPLAIYAVISAARGWYPLPNSVLLNGTMPDFGSWSGALNAFGMQGLRRLVDRPELFVLVVAAVALWVFGGRRAGVRDGRRNAERAAYTLLLVFIGTTLLHLQFAQTSWFLRYEAYLVCLGLTVVGIGLAVWHRGRAVSRAGYVAGAALALVVAAPLVLRGERAVRQTVRATQNIYQQQYHMGLFLRTYYPRGHVALNDIGAVSYLTEAYLLDLWGLASMDVARAKRAGRYDRDTLRRLARQGQIDVAVVYSSWFEGLIPEEWVEVARWRIFANMVCGAETVSFYAVDPAGRRDLVANLRVFVPHLPREVAYSVAGDPPLSYSPLDRVGSEVVDPAGARHAPRRVRGAPRAGAPRDRGRPRPGIPAPRDRREPLQALEQVYLRRDHLLRIGCVLRAIANEGLAAHHVSRGVQPGITLVLAKTCDVLALGRR